MKKTPTTVAELIPDPENRRAHNARNLDMVAGALRHVGAARSIVIDEGNVVLAGNGVTAAAAAAGITRVRIIDAKGDELIAVRRSGLSADEKRALAMYDNRAAELAEWNPDQLRADLDAGLQLEPWFSAEELETLTNSFAVDGAATPILVNGEKSPFQQMTFVLHDDQAEIIKAAIDKAKAAGGGASTGPNENSNGNALTFACAEFLRG